jgi:hypothetical protein
MIRFIRAWRERIDRAEMNDRHDGSRALVNRRFDRSPRVVRFDTIARRRDRSIPKIATKTGKTGCGTAASAA